MILLDMKDHTLEKRFMSAVSAPTVLLEKMILLDIKQHMGEKGLSNVHTALTRQFIGGILFYISEENIRSYMKKFHPVRKLQNAQKVTNVCNAPTQKVEGMILLCIKQNMEEKGLSNLNVHTAFMLQLIGGILFHIFKDDIRTCRKKLQNESHSPKESPVKHDQDIPRIFILCHCCNFPVSVCCVFETIILKPII